MRASQLSSENCPHFGKYCIPLRRKNPYHLQILEKAANIYTWKHLTLLAGLVRYWLKTLPILQNTVSKIPLSSNRSNNSKNYIWQIPKYHRQKTVLTLESTAFELHRNTYHFPIIEKSANVLRKHLISSPGLVYYRLKIVLILRSTASRWYCKDFSHL